MLLAFKDSKLGYKAALPRVVVSNYITYFSLQTCPEHCSVSSLLCFEKQINGNMYLLLLLFQTAAEDTALLPPKPRIARVLKATQTSASCFVLMR
jgi:hypothetical protein